MAGIIKKYGLIGFPLGHSLSPFIHERLFRLSGLTGCEYSLYEIKPEQLTDSYAFLDCLEGFNITIPHKTQIIPYCDEIDDEARAFGAVNCVYGKKGYNTDVYGFLKSLDILGAPIKSKVCVLGYGGAGRMAARAVADRGGNVTVAVRDVRKTDGGFKTRLLSDLSESGGEFDLVINTTPLGMFPAVNASPVDFKKLRADFVFDMIFNPRETLFLKLARENGAKTLSGCDMLVWQAVRSHEIWHGGKYTESDIADLMTALLAKLESNGE